MGLGQIQFGGLASGLDTSAIIDAILRLERRPLQLLEGRKDAEQEKISLLSTFEKLVEDLRSKAQDLVQANGFYAYALTEGTEGIATFALSDGALSGSHELSVTALASADRWAFDGVASSTTPLGAGSIDFTYDGTSYSVAVASGSDTLDGIAAAINTAADGAVTASVVNVGTSSAPSYRLVLAGNDTGADFTIQGLSVTGVALSGATNLTAASNAMATIDGLAVERSTNVFSDVLAGVSFTLSGVGSTTFTVDSDPEGVKANVQSFVDAYNAVVDFIGTQSAYDPDSGPGGDLFGDASLHSVRAALQRALFDVPLATVQGDPLGYSTLGLVGVEVDADGRLSIDAATFDEKLEENLDALASLFIDDTDGLLTQLDEELALLLESQPAVDPLTMTPILNPATGQQILIEGLFDRRRGTIQAGISGIDDEIERLEYRLEKLEESLVQRFANLEQVISGLNAQGAYLAGFPQLGA
jgi:flagellar hook-associated protein 2